MSFTRGEPLSEVSRDASRASSAGGEAAWPGRGALIVRLITSLYAAARPDPPASGPGVFRRRWLAARIVVNVVVFG
jgi:hypothetical protein